MMRLSAIWCHPIKGLGREEVRSAELVPGHPLPGDRAWALRHEAAEKADGWQRCSSFLRAASGPLLNAVQAERLDSGLRLTHPDLPELVFDPATEGARLVDWVKPIWPETRPAPVELVKAPEIGMGDNGEPSLSLLTTASLEALSNIAGVPLEAGRFRGNLVLEGAEAWAEKGWLGKRIAVGGATLDVTEEITRCRATEASTVTGQRDAETLKALRELGHQEFGVYAKVVTAGPISIDDEVTLL